MRICFYVSWLSTPRKMSKREFHCWETLSVSLKWGRWQIRIGRAIRDWGTTPPGDRGWDEGWKMQRREEWLIIFSRGLSSFSAFSFPFPWTLKSERRKNRFKSGFHEYLPSDHPHIFTRFCSLFFPLLSVFLKIY